MHPEDAEIVEVTRYYLATVDTGTVCHVVALAGSDQVSAILSNDYHNQMSH